MAQSMKGLKRSGYCGEFRTKDIGKTITVAGWVQRQRDIGNLIFIDLRDRTGILQLALDDETPRQAFEQAKKCRGEYVIAAVGRLREREQKNPDLPTGEIELCVEQLRILAKAQTPPFEITDDTKANTELRLTYRYLDLRRKSMQENLRMRHEIARVTREYFYENGFLEIETPMMVKSTPEGARDYLVPSRVHPGSFYALPQSPQIYKQLLMVGGYDRYIQLARCFRDEDLRADRQPEFTQIDLEMSFVEMEDILDMAQGYLVRLMEEIAGQTIQVPFDRMTYQQAMQRYGTDKPDLRYGMEICDVSSWAQKIAFGVFEQALQNGGSVQAIVAKNAAKEISRKGIDKLTEQARGIGAKGLAWVRWLEDEPSCSFGKFLRNGELSELCQTIGCEKGDVALLVADRTQLALSVLGALRTTLAKQLEIIPQTYRFVWITEFPFFEWDQDAQEWVAMHHPFTMPTEEGLAYLDDQPGKVKAQAFDLVLNGVELSSGSMRITDPELQQKMFEALGLTQEEIQAKFGFLVEAYRFGAPPHGGMGIGLDRLAMILSGAESLRDVTAFPKVQNASELMSDCPCAVSEEQLGELHIQPSV